MRRPSTTSEHLRALAAAANSTEDLAGSLDHLLALAQQAVPSCFEVTLTIAAEGITTTVTASAQDQGGPGARSSLALRIPRRAGLAAAATSPRLVLYASDPGVFDVVARDLIALLDTHMRHAEVDAHLDVPDQQCPGVALGARLDDRRTVDQALGILLSRGFLPAEGRAELERLASAAGTDHVEAARRLVRQTGKDPGEGRSFG